MTVRGCQSGVIFGGIMENILNNFREEIEKCYFKNFILCYLKKKGKCSAMELRELKLVNQNKFNRYFKECFKNEIKIVKGKGNEIFYILE